MKVKYNLNQYIYFKLTDKGKKRLKDPYFRACVGESNNDLYESQLWVFCGLFGGDMQYPSVSNDVETEVFFEVGV